MSNGHGGRRMTKEWTGSLVAQNSMSSNATALAGSVGFAIPGTILRILGEYVIGLTSDAVATDNCTLTVGIGIVSSDAVAAGAASMPDPTDEPNYPWLYWMSHGFTFEAAQSVGGPAEQVRHSFNVQLMRRFKPGQTLAMVLQYENVAGNPPLTILTSVYRVLIGT